MRAESDMTATTRPTWTNWSGGVVAQPRRIVAPASEEAIVAATREAARDGLALRVAGSGHSFTPLCATDGVLVSLDRVQGVITADAGAGRATAWAGTKISALGAPLLAAGLALENQGDVDTQALAGAIGTGTHGTGATLGSISTQVAGLRLVLADGEILDCSPDHAPDIFAAARLSLGLFGVVARVTLRALPAYRLHERTWVAPVEETFARLDELIAANRHCEFFWSPRDDACALKTLNPTDAPPGELPGGPPPPGRLARYVRPERIDWSWKIYPSERTLRFNELEFAVPAEGGPGCFHELRELMRARHPEVAWPIEYRTQRGDDIPLSPAYGRDSVTISVHQAADLPHAAFFADAEAVFRNHRGRPHWGKLHSHTARDLHALYPRLGDFLTLRARLDPHGRFLNPYLRDLLGA
jgi:FAD/FMN-containing dehydrogenase